MDVLEAGATTAFAPTDLEKMPHLVTFKAARPVLMAIIEELGLEAKVSVNGSAAAEYLDEEPNVDGDPRSQTTKTCHHYVESIDNAEFAIHVGVIPGNTAGQEWIGRSPGNALLFSVSFDGGLNVAGKWVDQRCGSRSLDGVYKRANATMRKFCFAPVSTVDDANKARVAEDIKVARNLGLIRVLVRRVVVKKSDKKQTSRQDENFATDGLSIAEKALKGKTISHSTALSPPVAIQWSKGPSYDMEYVDAGASPLAIFYFKYRSKEALQQQLIIRRPRSLSIESHLEDLSPDEIRKLARERLSQISGDKKRTGSVKDEDDDEVPESYRPFKFVRFESGKKAIDLTEDD